MGRWRGRWTRFVRRVIDEVLKRIEAGEIDPSVIITHLVPIEEGGKMYRKFRDKKDGCVKVVLDPWKNAA